MLYFPQINESLIILSKSFSDSVYSYTEAEEKELTKFFNDGAIKQVTIFQSIYFKDKVNITSKISGWKKAMINENRIEEATRLRDIEKYYIKAYEGYCLAKNHNGYNFFSYGVDGLIVHANSDEQLFNVISSLKVFNIPAIYPFKFLDSLISSNQEA